MGLLKRDKLSLSSGSKAVLIARLQKTCNSDALPDTVNSAPSTKCEAAVDSLAEAPTIADIMAVTREKLASMLRSAGMSYTGQTKDVLQQRPQRQNSCRGT